MAISLIPDNNLLIGAGAGILSKLAMSFANAYLFPVDAETQGYILVICTWLAAHLCDVVTGDNKKQ